MQMYKEVFVRHKTFLFNLLFVSSAFYFLLSILSFGYAQEQLTITTYYPSPYGSYAELRSKRMAVGDTWIDAATYPWDDDGGNPEGNEIRENADLVVEGNVGIGTRNPQVELHVNGIIRGRLECSALPVENGEPYATCAGDEYELMKWCSGNCDDDDAKVTICCKSP